MTITATETWSIGRLLQWTREFLAGKGVDEPRLSSELLLAAALGCRKIDLYTRFEQVPAAPLLEKFRALVRDAATHKPIAYLIGHKEFYSLDFEVTPAVLIPRPETEILVEQAVDHCRALPKDRCHVLDIGTGSGCVAIAIARFLPQAHVVATDISADALAVAARNVGRHGLADRITLVEADAADLPERARPADGFDAIVSNPPYIPLDQRDTLPSNVRDFEPPLALFGGPDGLNVVRRIAAAARPLLAPHGRLFLEIAAGRRDLTAQVLTAAGWTLFDTLPDSAGMPRVLVLGPAA